MFEKKIFIVLKKVSLVSNRPLTNTTTNPVFLYGRIPVFTGGRVTRMHQMVCKNYYFTVGAIAHESLIFTCGAYVAHTQK